MSTLLDLTSFYGNDLRISTEDDELVIMMTVDHGERWGEHSFGADLDQAIQIHDAIGKAIASGEVKRSKEKS